MTRILNSYRDVNNIINLMKYSERKAGRLPDTFLNDVKKAFENTTYGIRLNFLKKLKENSDISKYYEYFLKIEQNNEENKIKEMI